MMNGGEGIKAHDDGGHQNKRIRSDLLQLRRFDQRVAPRDGFLPHLLEIERALVLLRVPVAPAERRPAPAPEPG